VRLMNLINQILDFRQTETKGFSLDFTKVDINEILTETFDTFQPLAKKKKLFYTIQLPPHPVYAIADAEALIKIFSNLFSNAIKYAESEVYIKLQAPQKNDNHIIIEVQNDGYLIPYEMKEKIFEPFFRLPETVKQKGTGIGLALARSLTDLHKGSLTLATATNNLNTFVFCLPVTTNQEENKVPHTDDIATLKTN
jgi:signal transduction histidine kinase